MKKLLAIALLYGCTASGYAAAAPIDSPDDERIQLINYDETSVYTITTRYSYQTNIVFSPHEEIDTISVGDRSMWQIIPAGNRIFIRPMEENIITNMTVLTNKHSYQFDLKSLPTSKTEGNIYVAKFVYRDDKSHLAPMPAPAPAPAMTAPYLPPVTAAPAPAQPLHRNYNYTYAGPDDLAPVQIYDDGRATYIKFPDMTHSLPNIFIVESGHERPAAYNLHDGAMVVDTVTGQLALRSSGGTVYVYNELINPGK